MFKLNPMYLGMFELRAAHSFYVDLPNGSIQFKSQGKKFKVHVHANLGPSFYHDLQVTELGLIAGIAPFLQEPAKYSLFAEAARQTLIGLATNPSEIVRVQKAFETTARSIADAVFCGVTGLLALIPISKSGRKGRVSTACPGSAIKFTYEYERPGVTTATGELTVGLFPSPFFDNQWELSLKVYGLDIERQLEITTSLPKLKSDLESSLGIKFGDSASGTTICVI